MLLQTWHRLKSNPPLTCLLVHFPTVLRFFVSSFLRFSGQIRAMRDSNLPKFLGEDVPLFKAILVDLFPGVDVPNDDYGDLMVAIKSEIREHGLQEKPELIHKIIQLHDMIKIRFGVTIVGPTGGGKTVAYEIMCAAHTRLRNEDHSDEWYQKSRVTVINPKSITMGELFGENNELTQVKH